METLAARIAWVLEYARRPDGTRWNPSTLSHAAELSPNHVGLIKRGKIASGSPDSLARIAKAAGVSAEWLAYGKGSPYPDPPPQEGADPVHANLPNWGALRAGAAALDPAVPAWAWEKVARMRPLLTGPPTARGVAALARYFAEYESPPEGYELPAAPPAAAGPARRGRKPKPRP